MVTLIATVALTLTAPPPDLSTGDWHAATLSRTLTGTATYMDPGVMARAAANHGYVDVHTSWLAWLADRGYVGAVALNRAGDMGRTVWLSGPDGLTGPYFVADCAQAAHYRSRVRRGRVVEVDWATAQRWAMRGPLADVKVLFYDPYRQLLDNQYIIE